MRDIDQVFAHARNTTMLHIKSLTINVGDGVFVTTGYQGVTLWMEFYGYEHVPGNSEMPEEPAEVDITKISVLAPCFMDNGKGLSLIIDGRCDLLAVLTHSQISLLEGFLLDNPDNGSFNIKELVL